jgi:hypothetical protein
MLDLARAGDLDDRVEQPGGADHLFHHLARRSSQLVVPGVAETNTACAHTLLPLLEPQRPIVQGTGEPEPVLDQRPLAAAVPGVHGADLRDRDVRFVHEQQEILGKKSYSVSGGSPGCRPDSGRL